MAVARVGGVRHASHTWAHVRLHVVAEAILRIDRVAEITGNGPRAPKLLAGDAFAARCARSQVTLAVASSREIVHTGRIRCSYSQIWWQTRVFSLTRGASAEIAAASQVGTERAGLSIKFRRFRGKVWDRGPGRLKPGR